MEIQTDKGLVVGYVENIKDHDEKLTDVDVKNETEQEPPKAKHPGGRPRKNKQLKGYTLK